MHRRRGEETLQDGDFSGFACAEVAPPAASSVDRLVPDMNPLLKEIRHDPLLWLLVFVPVVFAAANLKPAAHTLHFILSVLAIVPLTELLSHATESVAAKTGRGRRPAQRHAGKSYRTS
jgi:hypothetical protein